MAPGGQTSYSTLQDMLENCSTTQKHTIEYDQAKKEEILAAA